MFHNKEIRIADVAPIYTGGGIYIYFGYVKLPDSMADRKIPFIAYDDFDYEMILLDKDPYTECEDGYDLLDDNEWIDDNFAVDIAGTDAEELIDDMYDFIIKNEPRNIDWYNYSMDDIEVRRDILDRERGER